MWGKGKGIDALSSLLEHFKHCVGFSFTCDFVRPIGVVFYDRDVANILHLEPFQKTWYCNSDQ